MDIGFVGLGRMGQGVAENLLKAGHRVTVWNRSPGPVAALTAKGALAAKTPQEAMQGTLLFSLLASDAVMRQMGFAGALLDAARKDLIHVNMATISPSFALELTEAHEARGLTYVSAPVFGRPDAAASGQLEIVAAGKKAALDILQPVFAELSRKIIIVGEEPRKANLLKIAGNFMIAGAIETMGEAFALLKKGGVDAKLFHEVMTERLFTGVAYKNYGGMILSGNFEPAGFALKLGLKDVNLARSAAEELTITLPIADLVSSHFRDALREGWAEKDWSAVGALAAKQAGV
jgi:3-hydroxyisobutyrate dehydrogenase-like beta-hydroxyacid dehydrogenase